MDIVFNISTRLGGLTLAKVDFITWFGFENKRGNLLVDSYNIVNLDKNKLFQKYALPKFRRKVNFNVRSKVKGQGEGQG